MPAEARPVRAGVIRALIALVVVTTNVVGSVVVVALTLLVIPLPGGREISSVGYMVAAAIYTAVAVPVGVILGIRWQRPITNWLRSGGPATPRVRKQILRLPLTVFWLQLGFWLCASLAFGGFAAFRNVERGVWVAVVVALTGATTASLAYLLVERLARKAAAQAMVGAAPREVGRGRGVGRRNLMAWAMGSGIPTAGLLILGIRTLVPSDVTVFKLALATVALSGTALIIGFRSTSLAARATADPIKAVAKAMARVHKGEYGTRVPVYDGTEIGRLQVGFNEMVAGLEEREQIRAAFGTYVDPAIADYILREGTDLAGEEIELSMLFVDIRNFTGFAERNPAAHVVSTINRMFDRAVPAIREHGGHVDKFVGDGLLAVFGAPRRLEDHATAAVHAALDIAEAVEAEFGGSLSVGIGVNTGRVVAGNVGGAGRFEFSVIGDPVNVAARIESATRQTGDTVLISGRTRELLDLAGLTLAERPDIELKGKSGMTALYAACRT